MTSPQQTTPKPTLLLVDDDAEIRDQMKWALTPHYEVLEAMDRASALLLIKQARPPLVLLDLGLPPDTDGASEGLAILREALQLSPASQIIVITGNSDRANAIAAIQLGAYDFIEKPVQLHVLTVVLQRAAYLASLEAGSNQAVRVDEASQFEGMIGQCPAMQAVWNMVRRVGPTDVPVLITGESGTGKELVAHAIHRHSERREHPFVAINCGAIPDTLLESELFGHEKGAFTGATQQRKGRIESAAGGTLLLDEIGDIPLGLQVKLLRFLQNRQIQRLGSVQSLTIDTRVLAATHVDLQKAIAQGRFREDLYYRLCVISIPVPPLNQRGSDIALLAKRFVAIHAAEHRKPLKGLTPQAIEAILAYSWPGNVRELENRIKRAVVMAEGKYITPTNLELTEPTEAVEESVRLRTVRTNREKELVRLAIEKASGNLSRAASDLGISRPTLYQLLDRYGIRRLRREDKLE